MRFFQIEFLEILHMAIYQTSSSIWDMTKKEIPCILECNTCCRRWRLRLQFPPCRSDVFTVCLCTNFWRAINCWSVIPSTSETSLYCVLEKNINVKINKAMTYKNYWQQTVVWSCCADQPRLAHLSSARGRWQAPICSISYSPHRQLSAQEGNLECAFNDYNHYTVEPWLSGLQLTIHFD